ncbi:DUF3307 domain-containing protein [Actinomadura madurae]|uniref:DUF3307 domain-containing protein n=1 Tax=Actinomadura madurae TaxID=1993 RepID=UPI0020D20C5A|nr:DUF3307 domain-containing protein [Actinomadura madurae]MCP9954687.1 DUF3307 domain-containing protein [Actinomadura madurae]MCP9971426.1 DUF3307 domain-containing protein [Actinomadura madurae]MCP9983916.1 DUF3307 domain-containing protein [Actinomadura madurae]MCQ0004518.1 DUF3307 domain-containing protein [Actinomadura madurae]MCQ0020149.1 DUF3307 domain-containing protein [Actinomadura madurae]
MHGSPIVFTCVFLTLWVAHQVGDHWVQTHAQACGKGAPGWLGRAWCARHVATLTATKAAVLAVVAAALALPLAPLSLAIALAVDAVSHYWADRRTTLARLADRLGKGEFARLGDGAAAPAGTGAYALDQSWHVAWLLIAALIACMGTG